MKSEIRTYTDEFKMQVVQEYLNTQASQVELLAKYSIGGRSSIVKWMRKFGLREPLVHCRLANITNMRKGRKKTPEELALEARVRELEKALEYEKLRTRALDTMINVAEDMFKIPIRKKPGTKQ